MSESLLVEQLGAVAKLTLNDPPFNRMSLDFMDELEQQVAEISNNSEIRAVLLTSSGEENFSVGMNLKQLPEQLFFRMVGARWITGGRANASIFFADYLGVAKGFVATVAPLPPHPFVHIFRERLSQAIA